MSCPFCYASDHGSAAECRRLTAELATARARIAELESQIAVTPKAPEIELLRVEQIENLRRAYEANKPTTTSSALDEVFEAAFGLAFGGYVEASHGRRLRKHFEAQLVTLWEIISGHAPIPAESSHYASLPGGPLDRLNRVEHTIREAVAAHYGQLGFPQPERCVSEELSRELYAARGKLVELETQVAALAGAEIDARPAIEINVTDFGVMR